MTGITTPAGKVYYTYEVRSNGHLQISAINNTPQNNVAMGTIVLPTMPTGTLQEAFIDVNIDFAQAGADAAHLEATTYEVDNSDSGGYTTAGTIPHMTATNRFSQGGSGVTLMGTTDIKAKVKNGTTLSVRAVSLSCASNSITLSDIRLTLRCVYLAS